MTSIMEKVSEIENKPNQELVLEINALKKDLETLHLKEQAQAATSEQNLR